MYSDNGASIDEAVEKQATLDKNMKLGSNDDVVAAFNAAKGAPMAAVAGAEIDKSHEGDPADEAPSADDNSTNFQFSETIEMSKVRVTRPA